MSLIIFNIRFAQSTIEIDFICCVQDYIYLKLYTNSGDSIFIFEFFFLNNENYSVGPRR